LTRPTTASASVVFSALSTWSKPTDGRSPLHVALAPAGAPSDLGMQMAFEDAVPAATCFSCGPHCLCGRQVEVCMLLAVSLAVDHVPCGHGLQTTDEALVPSHATSVNSPAPQPVRVHLALFMAAANEPGAQLAQTALAEALPAVVLLPAWQLVCAMQASGSLLPPQLRKVPLPHTVQSEA